MRPRALGGYLLGRPVARSFKRSTSDLKRGSARAVPRISDRDGPCGQEMKSSNVVASLSDAPGSDDGRFGMVRV